MGNGQLFNGQWQLRIENERFFPCPMPHDGRCSTQVNPKTALPPPCPMPHYPLSTN
ncbi:MAG: hypothetical protein KME31_27530 [Tolypothrix carrinoi HA7290-LM1]|nr:hypothetical protein [Tolypothrix carrinoi HA7290-LM1]